MGPRQTVQTQIRSDQGLHCLHTGISIHIKTEIPVQSSRMEVSTRGKRVNGLIHIFPGGQRCWPCDHHNWQRCQENTGVGGTGKHCTTGAGETLQTLLSRNMLLSVWVVCLYGKIIHELQLADFRLYRRTDYTLSSLLYHCAFAPCALGDIWCWTSALCNKEYLMFVCT